MKTKLTEEQYVAYEKNYREFARAVLKQAKYDRDVDFYNSEWGKTIRALAGVDYIRNVTFDDMQMSKSRRYRDFTEEELEKIKELYAQHLLMKDIQKKMKMGHARLSTAYEILGFNREEVEKKDVKELEPLSRKFLTKKELADYVGVPEIQFADFFSDLLSKGYKFEVGTGKKKTYRIYR